ncbi:UNVERIFIED_CONTAM: hypothetical protein K2H54_022184 [Gekko kuhli]
MDWALFSLAVLSYSSGVLSQATLTQPALVSVSPGETAKLSCMITGIAGGISWYQQRPGQAPRLVLHGTSTRGEGIPDRFTGSTAGNVGYLTITNIQAEDEADYYCGTVTYSDCTVMHCDHAEQAQNPSFLEEGQCRA